MGSGASVFRHRIRLGFGAAAIATIGAASAFAAQSGPPPTIAGNATAGQTLTAQDPAGFPYDKHQWQRCSTTGPTCASWEIVSDPHATTYTLTAADVDRLIRVRAQYTSEGSTWHVSSPAGPVAAASPPAPNPETPDPSDPEPGTPNDVPGTVDSPPPGPSGPAPTTLPPAVALQTANLYGIEGTVLIDEGNGFVPLTDPRQVALGVVVDATQGRVGVITAKNRSGAQQTVEFWNDVFVLTQLGGNGLLTNAEILNRTPAGGGSRVALRGGGRRGLWGRGNCKCRTEGNHSAGTVRGTWWLTRNRKHSTTTFVKKGRVSVKNFATGEKKLVRTGERYVARAR
jgi:hypothetical protein